MPDPGGCLHIFLPQLLRAITADVDRGVVVIRGWLGDRGCFAALVSSVLLVLVAAAVFGLDWGLWLVLVGVLVFSVVVIGGRYRLGAGGRSESYSQVGTGRRKVTSGPELVERYQAGERDFRKARLCWSVLLEADLSGVDLSGADLRGAEMDGARLLEANLRGANLRGADLRRANLTGANVSNRQLAQTASLRGATLPDGTVHQ